MKRYYVFIVLIIFCFIYASSSLNLSYADQRPICGSEGSETNCEGDPGKPTPTHTATATKTPTKTPIRTATRTATKTPTVSPYKPWFPPKNIVPIAAGDCNFNMQFNLGSNADGKAPKKHVYSIIEVQKDANGEYKTVGLPIKGAVSTVGKSGGSSLTLAVKGITKQDAMYAVSIASCTDTYFDSSRPLDYCEGALWSNWRDGIFKASVAPGCRTTPTPPPPPTPRCETIAVNFDVFSQGKHRTTSHISDPLFVSNSNTPSCLVSLTSQVESYCKRLYGLPAVINVWQKVSVSSCVMSFLTGCNERSVKCIQGYFENDLRGLLDSSRGVTLMPPLLRSYYDTIHHASFRKSIDLYGNNTSDNSSLGQGPNGGKTSSDADTGGILHFDSSCNPISRFKPETFRNECDGGMYNFQFYNTPISLLLDTTLDEINKSSKVVAFPLKPGADEYVMWKASEKAPLLVYDPEHKGEISSYTQLFGEWTFGGKATASANSQNSDANDNKVAWENGFTALATLDTNMDGKIAGEELESLALWFDKDQDAVSNTGEVRSLKDVGIHALYYKNPVKNDVAKDLSLAVGFERVVDGNLLVGGSVDWYGIGARSAAELIQKKDAMGLFSAKGLEMPVVTGGSEVTALNAPDPGFSGMWAWRSKDKKGNGAGGGLYALSESKEGVFEGTSIYQIVTDEPEKVGFSSAMKIFNILGKLVSVPSEGSSGEIQIFQASGDGTRWHIMAKLSADKKTLEGTAKVYDQPGDDAKLLVEYGWTAERYME